MRVGAQLKAACCYAAGTLREAVNDQRRCVHHTTKVHQPNELPYVLAYLKLVEYSIAIDDAQVKAHGLRDRAEGWGRERWFQG